MMWGCGLLFIVIYIIILLSISILSYRKGFKNIFSTEKSLPWFLAGFSLFVINPDLINSLSKMGIVANEGYSGLWIFYTSVLGAGLLPVIFAPLWSKLKFMTDNQFILIRFSGTSAKILHLFRAIYVGYFVVALFIAQVFIGMSKLIAIFFEVSYFQSFLVIAGLMVLVILKSSLRLKVRTDFFNGIIMLFAFAIGSWFVVKHFGGLDSIYSKLNIDYPDKIRLFPGKIESTSFETIPTLLVYFFIQWWSVNVLDGGGPEAQRFMNTRSPFQAFKAAFLPLFLFSLIFLLHSFVMDAGIIFVNESSASVPLINGHPDVEASFISLYRNSMPEGLSGLIFLAFMLGFLSIIESFINWGSGFVTVDFIKTYLFKEKSDLFYSLTSYFVMALIGFSGILIAWYNTHLLGLQKFIFAMGAGVGPVFILRWFWWRVNAWSQFTAMLGSLILASGWDLAYNYNQTFMEAIDSGMATVNMSYFAFKLVCLTIIITGLWISVTFLTKPDDEKVLVNFIETVNPGGFWRGLNKNSSAFDKSKLVLLVLYPVISILPFLFIWQFKFGNTAVAISMICAWIGLLYFTVRRMARDIK